jgi:hypothetical protein
VVGVKHKVVQGTHQTIQAVLRATGTGKDINTSYIERLNATFRSHLAALVRRGRAIVHKPLTLQAGMFVVGSAYNFCWYQPLFVYKPLPELDINGRSKPRPWLPG